MRKELMDRESNKVMRWSKGEWEREIGRKMNREKEEKRGKKHYSFPVIAVIIYSRIWWLKITHT